MQHALPFLFFAAAASQAFAQTPTVAATLAPSQAHGGQSTGAARARVPVHTRATAADEPAYGIWAAGDGYKASFHDGMTFVPCLGSDYPHNQPFAWRTTSVRVGSVELLAAGRAPVMTYDDHRVEYSHGAVVEAYDVLPHGLEQTFVLAVRPAGQGDLCVRGDVTTGLWTPAVDAHVGDLVFRDGSGLPIVRYGKAVAIDADGDAFAMTTTCVGRTITLRLAAADLERADFPLVVDPLLSPGNIQALGSAIASGRTDCASETVNTSVNSVYTATRHYSALDSDIEAEIAAPTLVNAAGGFYDLAANGAADNAHVAHVAATNRWVVVYQNLIVSTQQMQLRAATFASGAFNPVASISVPHLVAAGTHEWRPAVGGVADGGAGTQALVVFQQENGTATFAETATSRVMGMRFDTSTVPGTWSAPFVIRGSATEDFERPSVNRAAEGGASFSWFVVCQGFTNNAGNDDWDLFGNLVGNTGVVSANQWISSLGTTHKLGPVVDGRHGRFCVAFATASTSIGKNADVLGTALVCERLDWAHGDALPSAAGNLPAETLATNSFRVLEATGIAHNGASRSHWAIAWRSSTTAPALYATRVGYQGQPLQVADLVATTGFAAPGYAAVLHNDATGYTNLCYQTRDGNGANVEVRGFVLPTPAGIQLYGSGCAQGSIGWAGPAPTDRENQRIGCGLAGPSVVLAPANSLHLMLVATASANTPIAAPFLGSNCWLLVPFEAAGYLGTLPLAIGSEAAWQLPLPESLPAMTLCFQDWLLDPATNLFEGTRGLSVPLVK